MTLHYSLPPALPPRGNALTRAFGRLLLRALGWRIEGGLPDLAKFVVIGAPHSSNWDFFIAIGVIFTLGVDIRFLGKAEAFRWPLGFFMRRLGGIPVDREHPEGVTDQAVAEFVGREKLVLAIAPEGTRKRVSRWKTGFYRIAVGAGVPIVPAFFEWRQKVLRILPPFTPTGESDRDLAELRALYADLPRRDGSLVVNSSA